MGEPVQSYLVEATEGWVCGDDPHPSEVYGGVVGEAVIEISDSNDRVTSAGGDGRWMETDDQDDGSVSDGGYDCRTGDYGGPYGALMGSGGAVKNR